MQVLSKKSKAVRKAVVDFGTNTFHLLVADVYEDGTFRKLLHRKITVKLGQGGIHNGVIAPAALKRGLKAVAAFRKDLNRLKPTSIQAFGTSAIRDASNGKDFSRVVQNDFKIKLQIINGDREAELISIGVRKAVPDLVPCYVIMDIGGGSTEFIIIRNNKPVWKHSYKLGSSFLLEHYKPSDPLSKTDLRNMERHFTTSLEGLFAAMDKYQPKLLVGSAGSFETFASMIRYRFPSSGRHYGKKSHPIDVRQFRELNNILVASSHAQRMQMRGLLKMRADMIVPASILLNFVLKKSKIKHMILSSYSLKEGALLI
ncbi:MAG: exopolyphosphatase [Bacteroidota bacterium]|jgi:exopolyphosphatase/guanosine-5'-triphosphate,3'-diphosphate pyrophosphatase